MWLLSIYSHLTQTAREFGRPTHQSSRSSSARRAQDSVERPPVLACSPDLAFAALFNTPLVPLGWPVEEFEVPFSREDMAASIAILSFPCACSALRSTNRGVSTPRLVQQNGNLCGGVAVGDRRRWRLPATRSMAPEDEKMTRRSPLDFPVEWDRPSPGRRPDIFPQFSPMKTPLPPPLPADPPEEDEDEEEKKEEDPDKEPEKPEE